MVTYTQGPWKAIYSNEEGATYGEPIKRVKIVAPDHTVICDNEPYYPMELALENADLIAAAPELLEALEGLLSVMDGKAIFAKVAKDKAYAAVKKATGS